MDNLYELININNFNQQLNNAKKAVEKGETKQALDYIINANGYLSKLKVLDAREMQAKLIDVRRDLNKLL